MIESMMRLLLIQASHGLCCSGGVDHSRLDGGHSGPHVVDTTEDMLVTVKEATALNY